MQVWSAGPQSAFNPWPNGRTPRRCTL